MGTRYYLSLKPKRKKIEGTIMSESCKQGREPNQNCMAANHASWRGVKLATADAPGYLEIMGSDVHRDKVIKKI